MKVSAALQRGSACLACRKRKMKCDGIHPVCGPCARATRAAECRYYEKPPMDQASVIQSKIARLQAQLSELEAEAEAEDSGATVPQAAQPSSLGAPPESTPEGIWLDVFDIVPAAQIADNSDLAWHDKPFTLGIEGFDVPSGPTPGLSEPQLGRVWWADEDTYCQNKALLVDIFFTHHEQCAFDIHQGRFRASLMPSASAAASPPHPSLLNAIFLLGCFFSRDPALKALEPHFLARALAAIAPGLQSPDRIVQVLSASALLASYFFWNGRTLEGYYHSSTAARLAIGLKLHQISASWWLDMQLPVAIEPPKPNPPGDSRGTAQLGPLADEVEYAERLAAFWQIFCLDRLWAVATALPIAFPDDADPRTQIKTQWPLTIPDDAEPNACNGLPAPFPGCHLSGSSDIGTFRVKMATTLERSARSSSASSPELAAPLERAIDHFAESLADADLSPAALATMRSCAHAATIFFHRDGIGTDARAHEKCLLAANAIAAIARSLTDEQYDALSPAEACISWSVASDVYIRMLHAGGTRVDDAAAQLLERELDLLVTAFHRLSMWLPIAGVYAAKIQEERLAASSARHALARLY